jgi:hypothetical protein
MASGEFRLECGKKRVLVRPDPGGCKLDEEQPPTRARPRLLLATRNSARAKGFRSFHGVR